MQRFVLTGAPGAGKTSTLRVLHAMGHAVVAEAATDINAEAMAAGDPQPWMAPDFIDRIVRLRRLRQLERSEPVQVFDRSPVCTYALAAFLERPVTPLLQAELELAGALYEREVFFFENLGFCEPTTVRRMSFEDALRFEAIHEEVYTRFGYRLIRIPPAPPEDRAAMIDTHIRLALHLH